MTRFTKDELLSEAASSRNDYEGAGPTLGPDNWGYHHTLDAWGEPEDVVIEHYILSKFANRPHAHENGYA